MTSVVEAPATPATTSTPTPCPAPPAGRQRPVMWIFGCRLGRIGVRSLLFAGYLYGVSAQQQRRSQTLLYADLRGQLAQATAPVGAPLAQGKPMAYLHIPSIGLHQVVVEGISSGDLTQGPGHRPDSAWPGQPGVSVIAGKRATFGGPFARTRRHPLGRTDPCHHRARSRDVHRLGHPPQRPGVGPAHLRKPAGARHRGLAVGPGAHDIGDRNPAGHTTAERSARRTLVR